MEQQSSNTKLEKVLSKTDVFFLSVGSMVGWSWVALAGLWITSAGSLGSVLAFIIGGALIFIVGLTYAELSSALPHVGGEHAYLKRAFGRKASFIVSWLLLLGYFSVVTFEAVALPTVIDYLIPFDHSGYLWTVGDYDVFFSWAIIGTLGTIAITIINYFGVKISAVFSVVLSAIIMLIGILLIAGATLNGNISSMEPHFVGGIGGVMTLLVMVPFLFIRFDVIPQLAEEINLPPRLIGKTLMVTITIVALFYMGIALAVSVGLNEQSLSSSSLPTADAMGNLFGSHVFSIILICGGIAGIITSWIALMTGASRIILAMARSGMLPQWFAFIHPKYKTPTHAILVIGGLSMFAPFFGEPALVWMVNGGGLGIVVSYFMVAIAFIVLRKKEPGMSRPYRSGQTNIIGWLSLFACLFLIVLYAPGMPSSLNLAEWLFVVGWIVIGLYFYIQMIKNRYTKEIFDNKIKKEEK